MTFMIITKEMDTNILSGIVKFSNITKPIDTKALDKLMHQKLE